MAFKLPPEKAGWLGPEEHFCDTGVISEEKINLPAVKSSQPRVEYRPQRPASRPNAVGLNLQCRQNCDRGAFQKIPPKTDPFVVGCGADREKLPRAGFVYYPVETTEKVRQNGSVNPDDKRRDTFVYQTSTPADFAKTETSVPKVGVPLPVKHDVQSRGANVQKPQLRAKIMSCFGNRGQKEGSFYTVPAPQMRAPTTQEPMAIIDVDRFMKYENETPSTPISPVASPFRDHTSNQNTVAFDETKKTGDGVKDNKLFKSILRNPIERLPHTRFPKLSGFSPKVKANQDVSLAVGKVNMANIIPDGQVYSTHAFGRGNDPVVSRTAVQGSSAFGQDTQLRHSQEPLRRNWVERVPIRPPSRSNSPNKRSPTVGNMPGRGRSKDRPNSPRPFKSTLEMARKSPAREKVTSPRSFSRRGRNGLIIIDEEVHATHDEARDADSKEKQANLLSGPKDVIVNRLASPSRSRGVEINRQTSKSALSTVSKKRKLKERKYPDKESIGDTDCHENVIKDHNKSAENVNIKADWTGLSTYQARRDKFVNNNNRLDLTNPNISDIRLTKVHKTFEKEPQVYSTCSTEELGCANEYCHTKLRQGSPRRGKTKDCSDDDRKKSLRKEESGRKSRPNSVDKEEPTRDGTTKKHAKRPSSIKKDLQSDCDVNTNRNVTVNTLTSEQSRLDNGHGSNCDMGVQTHFENPSFRASDLTQRSSSFNTYVAEDDGIPTIEELNERFFTPATVLPTPDGGKDERFHDGPPGKLLQQTKDTQTMFRSSSLGQPIGKSEKFCNIVGPSSKVNNSYGRGAGGRYRSNGPPRYFPPPHNVRSRFDESQPYEHVFSDSVRVIPDFQNQQNCNLNQRGQNIHANRCQAHGSNFGKHGSHPYSECRKGNEGQDYCRDHEEYGSPDDYIPDEFESPEGYESPDGYESPEGFEGPNEFGSPEGHDWPGGYENPPPEFVGKPLGQENNNQVVEGAWDFMKNLFHKKKFRNAAYNKRAEVSCGDCGNGMRFTLSVGMQDSAGCLVCYNRIRDDFTELWNVYKEKGYLPCECKKTMSVTELVNGYLAQENLVCTCVGDAFVDLGK